LEIPKTCQCKTNRKSISPFQNLTLITAYSALWQIYQHDLISSRLSREYLLYWPSFVVLFRTSFAIIHSHLMLSQKQYEIKSHGTLLGSRCWCHFWFGKNVFILKTVLDRVIVILWNTIRMLMLPFRIRTTHSAFWRILMLELC